MPKKKKSDDTEEAINTSESIVEVSTSSFSNAKEQIANTWPCWWTLEQESEFWKKVWSCTKNRKIGYGACHKVRTLGMEAKMGMKISNEWANNEISHFGITREQQLTSLRTKIFKHKESSGHKTAIKILEEAKKETLRKVRLKSLCRQKEATAKILRTAYKVAKSNQSFNNFEMETNLQELNGVDMERILHSVNACINIINHISKEMKLILVRKIISFKSKISLIIDETTIPSQKSTLNLYIRVLISGCEITSPVNLFIDLIELDDVTATGIFSSLIFRLQSIGMTEEYLNDYLVSVTCDGAAWISWWS
jgi:hypothetical protein